MLVWFGNNQFLLNPDGSMYWIEEKSLIVGDLHLEKSTSYIDQGNFLPPYDTIDTLERLLNITKELSPNRIIFLGDVFHDNSAFDRLKKKEKQLFKDILKKNVIWVKGNHDNNFKYVNIKTYTSYKLKNFIFSHISDKKNKLEISAHYHPKVTFTFKGTKVSKPCFLIAKEKIILPAYGAYTGGLNISSDIYKNVFLNDYQIYALGNTKVLKIEKKF